MLVIEVFFSVVKRKDWGETGNCSCTGTPCLSHNLSPVGLELAAGQCVCAEDVKTYCLSQIKAADLLPAVGRNHLGGPLTVPYIHATPRCSHMHSILSPCWASEDSARMMERSPLACFFVSRNYFFKKMFNPCPSRLHSPPLSRTTRAAHGPWNKKECKLFVIVWTVMCAWQGSIMTQRWLSESASTLRRMEGVRVTLCLLLTYKSTLGSI